MPSVTLNLPGRSYDIDIGTGLLDSLGTSVMDVAPHEKAAIIFDHAIEHKHGLRAARAMKEAGFDTQIAVMPEGGESIKTLGTYRDLLEVLLNARLERGSPVVALGGGITGDVVGFVAASYLRGVPFVNCPTTLLSMVDASVGGKTGVNVPQGKNLVGAFHQPARVVIDIATLSTLPDRELRCGLAECLKHGMIRDAELMEWIGSQADEILADNHSVLTELVERNVAIKAAVVEADEREAGQRAHLNFGHTFGHAIEATTGYSRYLHGEAVALGMVAAARLAVKQNMCDSAVLKQLVTSLERVGLPTQASDLPPSVALVNAMRGDKKVRGGKIRLVLPAAIGKVVIVDDIGIQPIIDVWNDMRTGV